MRQIIHALFVGALVGLSSPALAQPLSTAFTFQGELDSAGGPAGGVYDFKFTLFDALTGGNQVGPQLCSDNVSVTNGKVTVQLDFGSQFSGQQRFLEVWVRPDTGLPCSNSTGYTILGPRQSLTAAPNSVFSLNAAAATNATQLNGQPASFYTNAANLTTGTVPDARLSSNAALLAGSQTFSGAKSFSSPASFSVANGTAPFSVTSSTKVANLNADLFDGLDSTAFPRLDQPNQFTAANSFGALGIGTTSPRSQLDVEGFAPDLLLKHSQDPGTASIEEVTGDLYFSFFNLDAANSWGPIPPSGASTYFLMSYEGDVGTIVQDPPTTGLLYFRTMLDDGNGNASIDAHAQNVGTMSNTSLHFGGPGSGEGIYSKRTGGLNQYGLELCTNFTSRLSISNSGNVGIGTTAPTATLHLAGATPGLRFAPSADPGYAQFLDGQGALSVSFVNPNGSTWGSVLGNTTRTFFVVNNMGAVQSVLDNGSSLIPRNILDDGTGNTSLAGTLGVAGVATFASVCNFNGGASTFHSSIIGNAGIDVDANGLSNASGLFQNQSNVLRFGALPSGEGITSKRTTGGNQFGLDFYTGNASRLSITNAGNVGIGTTAPTSALQVVGTLTATTKNFTIDHPLDPANKNLVHSCVESDEYKNIYDGTVVTDGEGLATITLPDWFPALNESFRYQLTVIDEQAPDTTFVRIAHKIGSESANTFTIKSVPANLEVSWQVTGVRKDAYVKAHPLQVEQDKVEKGRYLHPELFSTAQPPPQ